MTEQNHGECQCLRGLLDYSYIHSFMGLGLAHIEDDTTCVIEFYVSFLLRNGHMLSDF